MFKKVHQKIATGFVAFAFVTTGALLPVIPVAAAPGNNGTVKINNEEATEDPGVGNEPHLTSCTVMVRWYGFDEGERDSTVTFTAQSPTAGQLASPIGPQNSSFTAPVPTNGNTLSHEASYTLSFTGAPAAQGYHVKATVYTDGSKGNDTKSKVFWLPASCGPKTPEVVTPDFTLVGVCGLNNDTVNVTTSSDYTASAPVWDTTNHTVSVTFTMEDGVDKIFANQQKTVTITKDESNVNENCAPQTPETPNTPPTTVSAPAAARVQAPVEALPYTGSNAAPVVIAGAGLIAGAAVAIARALRMRSLGQL